MSIEALKSRVAVRASDGTLRCWHCLEAKVVDHPICLPCLEEQGRGAASTLAVHHDRAILATNLTRLKRVITMMKAQGVEPPKRWVSRVNSAEAGFQKRDSASSSGSKTLVVA